MVEIGRGDERIDNHITDDGLKYLLTALTRSSLGIVSKIEMAGRTVCRL